MEPPNGTKGWQRIGSILHLITRLASQQGMPSVVRDHFTGLGDVAETMRRNRFSISKNTDDSTLAVVEACVSSIVETVQQWAMDGTPPPLLCRHISTDWASRLVVVLSRIGVTYKLPYNGRLRPAPDPTSRGVQKEYSISQREAHSQIQFRRSAVRVTGTLLGVDGNGAWEMYEGIHMDRAVAVKVYFNTKAAERSFRSELAMHLRLSYHPNIPSLLGWAHSRAPLDATPSPSHSPRSSVAPSSPRFSTIPLSSPLADDCTYIDDFPDRAPDGPLLVLEHLDGPLDDVLPDRGFGKDSHRIILGQIIRAVIHIHTSAPQQLVHGLLNGMNILIGSDGSTKVTGIDGCQPADDPEDKARLLSDTHCNPCYQAPELLLATGKMLPSADVFSIGCLMLKLLTGEDPPLDPDQLLDCIAAARLPGFWHSLVVRCTADEPDERPTAAELLTIIENTPSLSSYRLAEGPDSDSDSATSASTTPVKSERQIRRDIGNELSLLGCSTTMATDTESECSIDEKDNNPSYVKVPMASEGAAPVNLLGVGTEPLIKRVPLEKDDDSHMYFPSRHTADDEWITERKERLLEIERLREEIRTIDNEREVKPFGFRQHIAEKISMTHFRNTCDVATNEATTQLRENGGRYKGTAYGELSLGLWCSRNNGDNERVEGHYKAAVELAQSNDAEPLCHLGKHYMSQYKAKVTQANLNCTILLLNDGVLRLSHKDMLPTIGASVVLPLVTGNIIWRVDQEMHNGVKLVTQETLVERKRIDGKFRTEESTSSKDWLSAENNDTLWKNGVAEIGLEMKDCGTWLELEGGEYKDSKMKKKLENASEALQQAADIDPTHLPAMLALCESQKLSERWIDAVATLRKLLKYHPRSAIVHATLAEVLHHHFPSEIDAAEKSYRLAIQYNGEGRKEQANLQGNLAIFLVHKGAKAAALDTFRSALALDPDHTNNMFNAGMFFKIIGSPMLAVQGRTEAELRRDPVLAKLGLTLLKHAGSLGHDHAELEAKELEANLTKLHPRHVDVALKASPVIPPDIDHLLHFNIPKDIPKGFVRPARSASASTSARSRSKSLVGMQRRL